MASLSLNKVYDYEKSALDFADRSSSRLFVRSRILLTWLGQLPGLGIEGFPFFFFFFSFLLLLPSPAHKAHTAATRQMGKKCVFVSVCIWLLAAGRSGHVEGE